MIRMTRHTLRISWAGPAVALALCYSAALAGPAAASPAPVPVFAPATAGGLFCVQEGYEFGKAVAAWDAAWNNYQWTLPGGTEAEILRAADELNAATNKVIDTGARLTLCLIKQLT